MSISHPPSAPVLRWIFQRGSNAITCELDMRTRRSYDVCIVPHWNVASAVVERFDTPALALLRHAELSRCLRENGWLLTDHVSVDRARAAA